MIRVKVNKSMTNEVILEQCTEIPSVYLDHWALRSLSEQMNYTMRFTTALKSAKGTLMLSWVNLSEFARVTDISQAQAAERLIDACIPNIFLLEANPAVVEANEDRLIAGGPKQAPHADIELARLFLSQKPGSVAPLSAYRPVHLVTKFRTPMPY